MQAAEDLSYVAPAVDGVGGTTGGVVLCAAVAGEQGAIEPSTQVAGMPAHEMAMCLLNTGLEPNKGPQVGGEVAETKLPHTSMSCFSAEPPPVHTISTSIHSKHSNSHVQCPPRLGG